MTDLLLCGHHRNSMVEIGGQPVCYICWLRGLGNYTYDPVRGLADQVRSLTEQVAEHELILHRLLNQDGTP